MTQGPYFNRNGDLVIKVDDVHAWLHSAAKAADGPDAFIAAINLAEGWNLAVNELCEEAARRLDRGHS